MTIRTELLSVFLRIVFVVLACSLSQHGEEAVHKRSHPSHEVRKGQAVPMRRFLRSTVVSVENWRVPRQRKCAKIYLYCKTVKEDVSNHLVGN
jgi:hypothetical protein